MSAQPPNQYPPQPQQPPQPPQPSYGPPYPPPTQPPYPPPTQPPYPPPTQPQYPYQPAVPYAPPPPTPPPGKPPFFTHDQMRVILFVAVPLVGILLLTTVGLLAARNRSSAPTPIAAIPTATATATLIPAPTATAVPCLLICDAVLGGTQDDFTAAYGQPEVTYSTPCYSFGANDGTPLLLCLHDLERGADGQSRVDLLDFQPGSSLVTLTPTHAEALAQYYFLPSDAKYQHDINDPNVGTLHVYQSVLLAHAFPASDFTNSGQGGGLVPPGTFSADCDNPVGPSGCTITIGT